MRAVSFTLLATAVLAFGGWSMNAHAAKKPLTLCTVASEVDLDPFKPIGDGSRHSMLDLFTRDYLSEDPKYPGLLDAFNFSADGKTFTGRVASNARWRDGAQLTALEAALGIAKGLTHRPAFPNIRVIGAERINEPGWETRKYAGVRILDERTFELDFDTTTPVENRVGVIRELLSGGELSNRLWPARLGVKTPSGDLPDVVSHYLVKGTKAEPLLELDGNQVAVHFGGKCVDADLTSPSAPSTYTDVSIYEKAIGESKIVLEVYLNPSRKGLESSSEREQVIGWMRGVASTFVTQVDGVSVPKAHFLSDESGFQEGFSWPNNGSIDGFAKVRKDISILVPNKTLSKAFLVEKIANGFSSNGVNVTWLTRDSSPDLADIILQPASNQGKRQVWLQKVLGTPINASIINKYNATKVALEQITSRSASTIPVDSALLAGFENAARKEVSIAPLYRYAMVTMSKQSSPVAWFDGSDARLRLRLKEGHR